MLKALYIQLLDPEWLNVFPASDQGQQMTQRCPAKFSTYVLGNRPK